MEIIQSSDSARQIEPEDQQLAEDIVFDPTLVVLTVETAPVTSPDVECGESSA